MPVQDFQDELIQDVLVAAGALGNLWQGSSRRGRERRRAASVKTVHLRKGLGGQASISLFHGSGGSQAPS